MVHVTLPIIHICHWVPTSCRMYSHVMAKTILCSCQPCVRTRDIGFRAMVKYMFRHRGARDGPGPTPAGPARARAFPYLS